MNIEKNGETKEVSGGRKKRVPKPEREGLGLVSSKGQVDGTEQIGISSEDRKRRDTTGSNVFLQPGNHSLGKILKRLELLEKAFNSYVGSHRQRLEARLDENKEFVSSFQQEMQLVKQEIYDLATQSNEEPE
ncbi:MAG: hypothetical protein V7K67_07580 [Nostoc sp.]|uniref:hypothetical protein n=1 Tax=Nostoc sp. TaxID=1180 RepID=UPI002FFD1DA9